MLLLKYYQMESVALVNGKGYPMFVEAFFFFFILSFFLLPAPPVALALLVVLWIPSLSLERSLGIIPKLGDHLMMSR